MHITSKEIIHILQTCNLGNLRNIDARKGYMYSGEIEKEGVTRTTIKKYVDLGLLGKTYHSGNPKKAMYFKMPLFDAVIKTMDFVNELVEKDQAQTAKMEQRFLQ